MLNRKMLVSVVCTFHIGTSEVADKVIKLHLAVGFNVLVVEVGVQHHDGECQQEHGVRTTELTHYVRVTFSVAASKRLQQHTMTNSFTTKNDS